MKRVGAQIETVCGPIEPEDLGMCLPHEHLFIDFVKGQGVPSGTDKRTWQEEIRLDNLFEIRRDPTVNRRNQVLDDPQLAKVELEFFCKAGGAAIVDVTPVGLGRRPSDLRWVSEQTGLHVVMGSGFYVEPYHPPEISCSSSGAIAERIVADITDGVDGVKAGIIGEIGLSWPVRRDEARVLLGAAEASNATGVSVSVHPGRNPAAPIDAANTLKASGVPPHRIAVGHLDGSYVAEAEPSCR